MTRQQIAECLDIHINYINSAFEAAIKEHPELNLYNPTTHNQKGFGVDYTLDQVLLAMSYFREGKGISEFEQIMLEEDFTMRPPETVKAKGIKGTEEFLKKLKSNPKKKCCATCSFCTKAAMRNRKPVLKPYCNFWNRFHHRMKLNTDKPVDPYNDYCTSWEYSNTEPLIFYTHDSPTNLDIYGNVKNEVMGFDVSNFGKDSEEVKLVTDVGIS
jgi:hypothetical protein